MTESEQIIHFSDELDRLVSRFRKEYDMSYASLIGIMFARAFLLVEEARTDES